MNHAPGTGSINELFDMLPRSPALALCHDCPHETSDNSRIIQMCEYCSISILKLAIVFYIYVSGLDAINL